MRSLKNREVLSAGIVLFLWAAVTPTLLFGQAATASISGRVTDASNAAVPNATVTIKNTATSATQTASTDEQGRYALLDLPIGPYALTISKAGFQNAGAHRLGAHRRRRSGAGLPDDGRTGE